MIFIMCRKFFLILSMFSLLITVSSLCGFEPYGLPERTVNEIKIEDSYLFACTDNGIYKCNLSAPDEWLHIGLEDKNVSGMIYFSSDSLLAYTSQSTGNDSVFIFFSENGGETWIDYQNNFGGSLVGPYPPQAMDYSPNNKGVIYARGYFNVAKSVNYGNVWTSVFENWDNIGYQADLILINPDNPSDILGGGETAFFAPYIIKSGSGGENWVTYLPDTGGDNAVYSACTKPNDWETSLFGLEGRIMKRYSGIDSFFTVYIDPNYTYFLDIVQSVKFDNTIYTSGSYNGTMGGNLVLFKSSDFGDSWEKFIYEDDSRIFQTYSLEVFHNWNKETVFLGTNHGIYKYDIFTSIEEPELLESGNFDIISVSSSRKEIILSCDRTSDYEIDFYDVMGRFHFSYKFSVNFSGENVRIPIQFNESGIYLYRIQGKKTSDKGKILFLK